MIRQNRLFYKLLQHYTSHNAANKGFVLPLVIGLGLIMTVAGLTMVIRSSDEQVTAEQKVQNAQAKAIAEAGITRSLSELSQPQNSLYATTEYEDWPTGENTPKLFDPCLQIVDEPIQANELREGEVGPEGTYEITQYQPNDTNPNPATLRLNGETGEQGDEGNAVSNLEVQVNINDTPVQQQQVFAPVYLNDNIDLGNNSITAADDNEFSVVCADCDIPDPDECTKQGKLTENGLKTAFNAKKKDSVEGTPYFAQIMKDDEFKESVPKFQEELNKECEKNKAKTCKGFYDDIGKINGGMTLPRRNSDNEITDDPDEDGIYHYKVDQIKLNGKNGILTINPPNDKEVYLYVEGDVTVGGKAKIESNNSTIDQFRIYGTGSAQSNQEFTLNGTPGGISGFIYAPDATVGINGNGQWEGIVWADKWGMSSGQGTLQVPTVSDEAKNDLIEDFPINNQLFVTTVSSGPTSFQRKPAK